MADIRVIGTPGECAAIEAALRAGGAQVLAVSPPRPSRDSPDGAIVLQRITTRE